MYLNRSLFKTFLWNYCDALIEMVTTSWFMTFDAGLAMTLGNDDIPNTRVQFPAMVRGWFDWRPSSLGEWMVRWFLALPALALVVVLCTGVALFKVLLWLLGLVPAIIICFLTAVRFGRSYCAHG